MDFAPFGITLLPQLATGIGARFEKVPQVIMWSETSETFEQSLTWIIQEMVRIEREARQTGNPCRTFTNSLESEEVDGKLLVSWPELPNFVVIFASRQDLQPWFEQLVALMKLHLTVD